VALNSVEQHKQYNSFVSKIKLGYEELNRLSSSVHAKLGHRKSWIYKAVKLAGLMPKSKKDKEDNFKISTIFFSSVKLPELNITIKKAFAPVEYAEPMDPNVRQIWSGCFPVKGYSRTLTPIYFDADDGVSWELWQIWAEKFVPVLISEAVIPDAKSIKDENFFSVLGSVTSEPKKGKEPAGEASSEEASEDETEPTASASQKR
jgi:hypothetical protein